MSIDRNRRPDNSVARQRGLLAFAIIAIVVAFVAIFWQVKKSQPHPVGEVRQMGLYGKGLWLQQQKKGGAAAAAPINTPPPPPQ